MSEPGDIESRVGALEGEVGELKRRIERSEHDSAAARVLAGGADRDVAEIRTEIREFREQNTRLHNATRADITDIRTTQNAHSTVLNEIRGKFDLLAAGQQRIVELLGQALKRDR